MKIDLNNEKELRAALRELKADYEVIELALKKFAPAPPSAERMAAYQERIPAVHGTPRLSAPPKQATLAQRIRESIDAAGATFAASEIYQQFTAKDRPSIKEVLRRQKEKGLIEVIQVGIGRKPSIYKKSSLL